MMLPLGFLAIAGLKPQHMVSLSDQIGIVGAHQHQTLP